LRQPNDYQSISDFMLNTTRSLYLDGNAYALVFRNNRYEPEELHWMDACQSRPFVTQTGEIFYYLGGNDIVSRRLSALDDNGRLDQLVVPARDVLHIRLHSNNRNPFPLIGEAPLLAALDDLEMYDAIKGQQEQFFKNQAWPALFCRPISCSTRTRYKPCVTAGMNRAKGCIQAAYLFSLPV
jgi:phage portal protein BeeE